MMKILHIKNTKLAAQGKLIGLFILAMSCLHAKAQTCQPNMDFGLGTYADWKFQEGLYEENSAGNGVLQGTINVTPPTTAGTAKRFTIESAGPGVDPYGGFPVNDPTKVHSLRLGYDTTEYCVNTATYQVHVPAGTTDYALIYRYAVVLENPASHTPTQQPEFIVSTIDSLTGAEVPCGNLTYANSNASPQPGFTLSTVTAADGAKDVYYKSWSTASLNLSGYAGQTVTVSFQGRDCALGGHFGYGYVDMTCGLFAINTNLCLLGGNTTLSAPPGFSTYRWYNAAYTTIIGTTDTTIIATPSVTSVYHVVCTPFTGYGCPDTLTTTVVVSNLSATVSDDTAICQGNSASLNAVVSGGISPITIAWSPSASLSCSSCPSVTATPASTTTYSLSVSDATGCQATGRIIVTVNLLPVVGVASETAICQGGTTTALGGSFGGGATSAIWTSSDAGGSFTGNGGSTPGSATYTASSGSSSPVTLTLTTSGGLCGTTSTTTSLAVNPNPTVGVASVAAICQGGTTAALGGSFGGGATSAVWTSSDAVVHLPVIAALIPALQPILHRPVRFHLLL